MAGADFLRQLNKQGALQLVEPSEPLKDAYQKKSEGFLFSARLLLDNDRLEESVSLAYYSMYYSVVALLFRTGIKCENHTAAAMLLKLVFGQDPADLVKAKAERIETQYYIDADLTREDVKQMVLMAERFDGKIFDMVERMSTGDIERYRGELERILSKPGKKK
jgi:uncharacterized protein (UPF0332 family)